MDDNYVSSSPRDYRDDQEKRSQLAVAMPLLGAAILWLLLSNRFPLVETRLLDVVILIVVALGASALWTLRGVVRGPVRGPAAWSFLWTAALLILLFASVVPTLNTVLDQGAPRQFTTIVNEKNCRKGICIWELRGVKELPVGAPTMTLEGLRTLDADVGDSLVLGIKPGRFGRAWIASRDVHHVERSRLACARLAGPAAAGDTLQLGDLLAEGLSIESAEAGLNCEAPLIVAARTGQVDAVGFLLRRGADPNHATPQGETALMNAVRARSLAAVRVLIAHDADARAIGRPGGLMKSVMELALEVGDTAIIGAIGRAIPRQASVGASRP